MKFILTLMILSFSIPVLASDYYQACEIRNSDMRRAVARLNTRLSETELSIELAAPKGEYKTVVIQKPYEIVGEFRILNSSAYSADHCVCVTIKKN